MLSPGGCLLPSASPNIPALIQTGSISARSEEFLPTADLPVAHNAATPPRKCKYRTVLKRIIPTLYSGFGNYLDLDTFRKAVDFLFKESLQH